MNLDYPSIRQRLEPISTAIRGLIDDLRTAEQPDPPAGPPKPSAGQQPKYHGTELGTAWEAHDDPEMT